MKVLFSLPYDGSLSYDGAITLWAIQSCHGQSFKHVATSRHHVLTGV